MNTRRNFLNTALLLSFAFCFATWLTGCGSTSSTKNTPPPPPTDPDGRADLLIAQMTEAEKLQLVHGNLPLPPYPTPPPHGAVYWVPAISRLEFRTSSGPTGRQDWETTWGRQRRCLRHWPMRPVGI